MYFDERLNWFVTDLLWQEEPDLKNNYSSAKSRLDSPLTKLGANRELKLAYIVAMDKYIRMGVVERVYESQAAEPSGTDLYFLLHRAVNDVRRISTKCQIVFDGNVWK